MGIYTREHFKTVDEAAMYYISVMHGLTEELTSAVMAQNSQKIVSIGNIFIDVSNMLGECQKEQINIQQEEVRKIMRPHLS